MKIKHLSLIFFMGFIAITTASCSVNTNSQTNNTSEVKTEETHSNTTPENITTNTGDTSNTGETTPAVEKVTVTFNTNGGSSIAPVEINKGTKVTKPGDPTKAEDATAKYTFAGWFKDAACTTAFDFSSNIDSNTIVYAKWDTQGKFTVSFNTKGGSDVTAQTVLAGEKAKQPTTDPTKANDATNSYTFAGWFKDEACTQAFDFNTAISAATVIYAGWTATPLEFTVTFNTNGGSDVTAQTVTAGGKATQPTTDPTKAEDEYSKYVFAGWFKDAGCTTAFDFDAEITEPTTIYAGWTEIAKTFKITINSDAVAKDIEIGNKIDLSGMIVTATDSNSDTKTVAAADYKVTVTDPSNNTFDIANNLTDTGKYTVKVEYDGCNAKFDINVTAPQYKFNVNWSASELASTYDNEYTFPDGTYTLFETKALKVGLVAQSSNSQVKFQNDSTGKTLENVTYNYRISIHAKYGYMTVTPAASGKITILATVNGADRKIVVKQGTDEVISGATDWASSNLYALTFDVEANKTYTINSSSNGSVVYAVNFAASVNESDVVATDTFSFTPTSTQFDIKDSVFNTASIAGTAVAANNYGIERTVAADDLTFTVKNASNETVTGEIKTVGTYTVTVAYDGKEVSYPIVVEDKDAVITAVNVDSTNATKKFYEGGAAFNANNIEVTAEKGVTIDLTAEDYTVKLYSGDTEVTEFTTTGEYTVRVYAKDTTVYGSYTVNYYQITGTTIKVVDTAKVAVGTAVATFKTGATASTTYADTTSVDVTKDITVKYYSSDTLANEVTDPFAAAGTVYAALTAGSTTKTITITVAELTATTENYSARGTGVENYGISTDEKPTAWTYSAAKVESFEIEPTAGATKVKLVKIAKESVTYTLTEASNTITLSLTGGTSGSGNASDYLQIDFLDANGNVIETVIGTTPAGKVIGDFTFKSLDGATTYEFVCATACKSIKFSSTNTGKSVGIDTATIVSYN